MKDDFLTDLMVLQSHLDAMLERMQSNSITLKRFQTFEIELLNLNSLAEMLDYILNSQDFFKLDYIGFCIVDAKKEIRSFLVNNDYDLESKPRLIFMENHQVMNLAFGSLLSSYIGAYKTEKCADFFLQDEKKLASVTVIPLVRKGKFIGALSMGSFDPERFVDGMSTDFIEHMTYVLGVCLENHLNYEVMKSSSLVDTLTGVNNRRFLEQRLGEEIDRAQRNNEALTCFFLDIDFFKKINDDFGHQAGDQVLVSVAAVIREQLRNSDVLARYGGDEFIALLGNIEESMAIDIAERIRGEIKDLVVDFQEASIKTTISIGSVTYKPSIGRKHLTAEKIGEDLIKKADKALYLAKNQGRDKVVSSGVTSDYLALANLFK
ncbi:diguanylate cyclase [Methyloprofundus sedimenti]|uniref:diguanylate cyclase n=1 Tax=Methyloprofundus sedimenti TaxID=1420851 RepID=A0A1V8M8D9_9GAMM|nr:sensor domain-containing diguanylate cyclase [Methyloprofundus sedimenti]OQK17844.1 diguanylate cyclase [Methyloprofundus sedimenti]